MMEKMTANGADSECEPEHSGKSESEDLRNRR
jgi:hypothetical protein